MEQIPLFDDLAEHDRGLFHWSHGCRADDIVAVAPGQPVFQEGVRRDFLYEVVSGTLKSWRVTEDGHQLIFGFPSTGDIIGVAATDEYTSTVEAVTPAKLIRISRVRFQKEVLTNNLVVEKLMDWINRHERQMQWHISILSMRQPVSRAAAFLLKAEASRFCRSKAGQTGIYLPMTQRDIATYLAMAPETYSRIMRKFRESGILRMRGSSLPGRIVEISDRQQLRAVAQGKKF